MAHFEPWLDLLVLAKKCIRRKPILGVPSNDSCFQKNNCSPACPGMYTLPSLDYMVLSGLLFTVSTTPGLSEASWSVMMVILEALKPSLVRA